MQFLMSVAVVSFWSSCAIAGNLLFNGDLELGTDPPLDSADGWTLIEPDLDMMGMPENSAEFINFANHTPGGERGLWLRSFEGGFGMDSADTVDAHLLQAVPGAAGVQYMLSAYFRYEAHYSGIEPGNTTQTILAIDFLDAAMVPVGGVELDIDTVQMNDSVWRQFSVDGVSPAGTAFVRARVSMLDGTVSPMNPQSAFVDDLFLVPTPTGTSVLLGGIAVMARRRRS